MTMARNRGILGPAHMVPSDKLVNRLGVDVTTTGAAPLRKALEGKKSTMRVVDAGQYNFGGPQPYNQLWVDTTMTEDELDAWCCRIKAGAGLTRPSRVEP